MTARLRSDGSGPAAAVLSACEAARPHARGLRRRDDRPIRMRGGSTPARSIGRPGPVPLGELDAPPGCATVRGNQPVDGASEAARIDRGPVRTWAMAARHQSRRGRGGAVRFWPGRWAMDSSRRGESALLVEAGTAAIRKCGSGCADASSRRQGASTSASVESTRIGKWASMGTDADPRAQTVSDPRAWRA